MNKQAIFALLTLIGLGISNAQANSSDVRKRKAVVYTDRAELCLEDNRCYPVLIGKTTPKGTYPMDIVRTQKAGYGGDVIKFKEENDFMFAIHRVWTLKPSERRMQRIASPVVADRVMTNGCINVTDDLYNKLKAYFVVEIR